MPAATAPPVPPLLLTRRQSAAMSGVSPATWDRMTAAGRTPAPVRLSGGCVRFRRSDLLRWVALGCPPRDEFEAAAEV
jgi:predicted DNA-binding transcriptional regulator AlpA